MCEIPTLAFSSLNHPATSLFTLICLLVPPEQGQKVLFPWGKGAAGEVLLNLRPLRLLWGVLTAGQRSLQLGADGWWQRAACSSHLAEVR